MLIDIPVATPTNAYASPLKDRLTNNQRMRLLSILAALRANNATLVNGSRVEHEADVVRWILEQEEAPTP
jgi:hypothetical protein